MSVGHGYRIDLFCHGDVIGNLFTKRIALVVDWERSPEFQLVISRCQSPRYERIIAVRDGRGDCSAYVNFRVLVEVVSRWQFVGKRRRLQSRVKYVLGAPVAVSNV